MNPDPRLPPPLPPTLAGLTYHSQPPPGTWCRFCHSPIPHGVQKCRHCGEFLSPTGKSDGLAGCLGLALGPVGLWYKGLWGAGFAWLAVWVLLVIATGGFAILLAPIFWLGMGIHSFVAKARR
jgi:hypothetical protein